MFSADGKYLFFVSHRNYHPGGHRQAGSTRRRRATFGIGRIYFVTLAKDTKSLVGPEERRSAARPDEKKATKGRNGQAGQGEGRRPKKVVVKVDLDGLPDRIGVLPLPPSNYGHLTSVGERLYYCRTAGRRQARLLVYDFENGRRPSWARLTDYRISADGKKMLVRSGQSFAITDLPPARWNPAERSSDLSNMKVQLDRRAEWKQIYRECWRQMRDFLYAPNMQGVDWPKKRALYEPLLPYVESPRRSDLRHRRDDRRVEPRATAYVGGGDYPQPAAHPARACSARKIERDPASGYFRIARILKGENWDPKLRSPLTEIGVNVKQGDYILAVDGKPTNEMKNIYAALVDTAGKQVTLRVNSQPQTEGSHETVVVPTADERPLYYLNWVQGNIERVSKATGGKIAYVHIPDMGPEGLNEFVKLYYPADRQGGADRGRPRQRRRQRLAADHRVLRREAAMITMARNTTGERRSDGHDPRAEGDALERVLRFRRRHRGLPLQEVQARAGDRQALVGRGGRHPRLAAACWTAAP